MRTLQIKKLNEMAVIPSKGSNFSAGYDLSSAEDYTLMPLERKLFKTGLSISIPNGLYGRIAPRSGLAFKDGIDVLAGVIDEDYRGEIGVILINLGKNEKCFKKGDKIAQIIFEIYNNVNIQLVDELSETDRGEGGFGSTDNPLFKLTLPADEPLLMTTESVFTATPIMEQWKKTHQSKPVVSYESIVKEREKNIE